MAWGALEGVRVVEYGEWVAAPYAGKLFADMGAEVIKVEPPTGDSSRSWGPFPGDVPSRETSGLFLYLNTNKIGVTLDVSKPTGRRILEELLSQADVFIVDKTTRQMEALGLPYTSLGQKYLGLVVTAITPFGLTGPYAEYRAYPLNTNHAGGEGFLLPGGLENAGRPPTKAANFASEYDGAMQAVLASVAALYSNADPRGQLIDISKQESTLSIYDTAIHALVEMNHIYSRNTVSPSVGGVLPCKDGYVEMWMWFEEWEWPRIVQLLGSPEWANDARFQTWEGRRAHMEELNLHIMQWTLEHTKQEIYTKAQELKCPFGMYSDAKDLLESPQLQHRRFFRELRHPVAGTLPYPTLAFIMSETPWQGRRAAPLLGEHNDMVYCERLGRTREELGVLGRTGVI